MVKKDKEDAMTSIVQQMSRAIQTDQEFYDGYKTRQMLCDAILAHKRDRIKFAEKKLFKTFSAIVADELIEIHKELGLDTSQKEIASAVTADFIEGCVSASFAIIEGSKRQSSGLSEDAWVLSHIFALLINLRDDLYEHVSCAVAEWDDEQ